MSLENSAKSADPILISFVELVEQDARVLEAYAAVSPFRLIFTPS